MFRDPWGNNIQVVDYRDVQFTKAPEVLGALVPGGLEKSESALAELEAKGMAKPPSGPGDLLSRS
jgi:hypothetical protein